MKNIKNLILALPSLLAFACGAPADDAPTLDEHLGELGLAYTADDHTVGWDMNDGWQGRYCGGWGTAQSCCLPPNKTIKYHMASPNAARNASVIAAASALSGQVSGWSWTAGTSTDYDIRFTDGALGGSTTSTVISRYIHIACVDGTPLSESLDGTWLICNKHEATVDYAAIAAHCPGTALDQCLRRVHSHGLARAAGVGSDALTGTDALRPSSRHLSAASSPSALLTLTPEEACGVGQLSPTTNPGTFSIPTAVCD